MLLQTNTEDKSSICTSNDLMLSRLGFALGSSQAPEDEPGGPTAGARGAVTPRPGGANRNSRTRRRSRAGRDSCRVSVGPGPGPPRSARVPRRRPLPAGRARRGAGGSAGPAPAATSPAGFGRRAGPRSRAEGAAGPERDGARPRAQPPPLSPARAGPCAARPALTCVSAAIAPLDPGTGSGFRGGPGATAMGAARPGGSPGRAARGTGTGRDGRRLHRPDVLRARPALGPAGDTRAEAPRTTAPCSTRAGAQPLPAVPRPENHHRPGAKNPSGYTVPKPQLTWRLHHRCRHT